LLKIKSIEFARNRKLSFPQLTYEFIDSAFTIFMARIIYFGMISVIFALPQNKSNSK